LKKIINFKKDILNEFCSRDLETLIRLAEAFSKITLSSEVQIFHIKASARMIFNSVYLNGISKSDKRINTVFLEKMNKMYPFKKYGKFVKTKFYEYSLISKKLFLIIKNKKNQKLPGIFFLNLSKTFFFYFSQSKEKNIGLKRIKIFVNTLKHIVSKTKRLFITRLSRNSTFSNDGLILSIT
jgi:DNA replicative helicase MCM subunit Mcm2 (Cdc46/Mcm family)